MEKRKEEGDMDLKRECQSDFFGHNGSFWVSEMLSSPTPFVVHTSK